MKNKNTLLNVLLGTGLYLLDPVRDRLADSIEGLRDKAEGLRDQAEDNYETASDRLHRAHRAIRGEDHSAIGTVAAVAIGLAVGVGVGLLLAPSSGEETRNNIASKVNDIKSKAKDRFEEARTTGSY